MECEIELSFIEQRRYRAGYNTRQNWSCVLQARQDQLGISLVTMEKEVRVYTLGVSDP